MVQPLARPVFWTLAVEVSVYNTVVEKATVFDNTPETLARLDLFNFRLVWLKFTSSVSLLLGFGIEEWCEMLRTPCFPFTKGFTCRPIVAYGSGNWALNRAGRRRIETAEMRFLRRVSGHTLRDHIRNTTIREELHIYDLNDKIADMKVQWLQHIDRMDPERLTKQVLHYTQTGRRSVGRPIIVMKPRKVSSITARCVILCSEIQCSTIVNLKRQKTELLRMLRHFLGFRELSKRRDVPILKEEIGVVDGFPIPGGTK
ncbi:hypothetical protein C0J52_26559 [Blattella germanica]|nr:hypothetical protein C0J52_26559 [Blattella germanica]